MIKAYLGANDDGYMQKATSRNRTRNARQRALRQIAVGTAISLALGGFALAHDGAHSRAGAATAPAYEAPVISDSNYAIPTGAIFVSNSGSDTAAGTQAAPLLTIGKALSVATAGKTVVLRGGTYREQLGLIRRTVTIQAYPHEQAWIKGSKLATGFAPSGGAFSKPWISTICANCFPSVAIDPNYPAAGSPEQVFLDGVPQVEVLSRGAVVAGSFFMDRAAKQLWLGTNPTGRTVEVTAFESAALYSTNAPGSALKGIGIAHFGSHYNTDTPGMVTSTADNMFVDRVTFAFSAGRGLSLFAKNQTVSNSLFLNNGLNGLHSHRTSGFVFRNNRISYSNYERFSILPSAVATIAAAKITYGSGGVYQDNIFSDNTSNGLWIDVSASNNKIVNNTSTRNAGHGIAVEVSANTIVAGNVITSNGRDGLKISGANIVDVYNNTIANNGWAQLGVYEDPRKATSPTILALGVTWDTTNVRLFNNVIVSSNYSTRPVLNSFDLTSPRHLSTASMIAAQDNNIWGRTTITTGTRYLASVQATLSSTGRYADLPALKTATSRERLSKSSDNVALATMFTNPTAGNWKLTTNAPAMTVANLPSAVATAMGVPVTPSGVGALRAPIA